jgi:hypothetical protein
MICVRKTRTKNLRRLLNHLISLTKTANIVLGEVILSFICEDEVS